MSQQFLSEDKVKADITLGQLFARLWPYCRRHLGMFSAVFLSVVGLAICSRILPFLIGYAIDHGVQKQNLEVLKFVALAYLGVQIL